MSISGKVALVTGAGQGIGRAIALRLANDGADIAIVDVNEGKMKAVADEVRKAGRRATTFKADVTKRDEVYAAVDHAEKELGGFDIMVNNAGIAQVQPLADVTPEEVDKILKVNVQGVLWGIQAAAKKFKQRRQKGKIISASSIAGHEGFAMLGRVFGDQVRRAGADAGGGEGVRERRHHGQRLLPRHRRHRHVGRDRPAVRRDHRAPRSARPTRSTSRASRWAARRRRKMSPRSSRSSRAPIPTT